MRKVYKLVGFKRDSRDLEGCLNTYASQGWRLHSLLDLKSQPTLMLIFERDET